MEKLINKEEVKLNWRELKQKNILNFIVHICRSEGNDISHISLSHNFHLRITKIGFSSIQGSLARYLHSKY